MEELLLKMQSKPIMKKYIPVEVAIPRLDEDELTSDKLIIKDMTENRYDIGTFMKTIGQQLDVKEPAKEQVESPIIIDKSKETKGVLRVALIISDC